MSLTSGMYQRIKDSIGVNTSSTQDSADVTAAQRALGCIGTYVLTKNVADSLANSTSTTRQIPVDMKIAISDMRILPEAALTSDNTTYANVSLEYDDGNAGSSTQVALVMTKTTLGGGSGDWVAGTRVIGVLSSTTANLTVDGTSTRKYLSMKIAKASTGVVVPACTMFVDYSLTA